MVDNPSWRHACVKLQHMLSSTPTPSSPHPLFDLHAHLRHAVTLDLAPVSITTAIAHLSPSSSSLSPTRARERTWCCSRPTSSNCGAEGGRRVFGNTEEVRLTHCRVAPTRASPRDWKGDPVPRELLHCDETYTPTLETLLPCP